MNVNFDKVADAIFFTIREGVVARTIQVSESINADVDANGHVLGIEVLNVTNQFGTADLADIEKSVLEGIPLTVTSNTPAVA